MRWESKALTDETAAAFKQACATFGFGPEQVVTAELARTDASLDFKVTVAKINCHCLCKQWQSLSLWLSTTYATS